MSESWALTARYSEGPLGEFLLPPTASRRERGRGDVDGGSSNLLHSKRSNGPFAFALAAFASVVAILFVVLHCVALSREALLKRVGRRLAKERETNRDESACFIQQVCGEEESQWTTATHSARVSRGLLGADPLGDGSDDEEDPPKKKRQEDFQWHKGTSHTTLHAVASAEESAGQREDAEKLRKEILWYVKQTLAEKNDGLEEDWLRHPFEELHVLSEELGSRSLHTLQSLATEQLVEPSTSGLTAMATRPPESAVSGITDVTIGPPAEPATSGPPAAITRSPIESAASGFPGVATGPLAEPSASGFTAVAAAPPSVAAISAFTNVGTGSPVQFSTSGISAVVLFVPETVSTGSLVLGKKRKRKKPTQCSELPSSVAVPSLKVSVTSQGTIVLQPAAEGGRESSRLFKYISGSPGTEGAYMIVGSEIPDFQGRPALAIISVPLVAAPGSEQRLGDKDITTHPFCRLPSVAPGAKVRDIKLQKGLPCRRTPCEARALLGIKELLKRPVLVSKDLHSLMQHLERLVGHCRCRVKENVDGLKPKYAVERLAFAMLVTDAVYAASEVLGASANRQQWWQSVIDTLPVYTGPRESAASRITAQQNVLLAQFLQYALEFYRCGARPPAPLLVRLKQVLLCTSAVPSTRRGAWAQFMRDDTEWQQSQ